MIELLIPAIFVIRSLLQNDQLDLDSTTQPDIFVRYGFTLNHGRSHHVGYSILGIIAVVGLFCSMLMLAAIGHKVGRRKTNQDGIAITEGAVFTLMALLVAFTFSNASSRFDQRRTLIIDEVNAISTAYLRLDILQSQDRAILQKDFNDYVNSRITIYQNIPDIDAVYAELNKSKMIGSKLWHDAVNAANRSQAKNANMLILPPINSMFDIASTRVAFTSLHLHYIILSLLLLVALLSAFIIGYGTATKKHWLSVHIIAYSLILSVTIYIILDIEYPRYGIIKSAELDILMIDLKKTMMP